MSNKEQTSLTPLITKPLIVEGGYDRLSCSGRGDQKVAMATESAPLRIKFLENFDLIRARRDIKGHQSRANRIRLTDSGGKPNSRVVLECRIFPVDVEQLLHAS